jgi:hypothetical protein
VDAARITRGEAGTEVADTPPVVRLHIHPLPTPPAQE